MRKKEKGMTCQWYDLRRSGFFFGPSKSNWSLFLWPMAPWATRRCRRECWNPGVESSSRCTGPAADFVPNNGERYPKMAVFARKCIEMWWLSIQNVPDYFGPENMKVEWISTYRGQSQAPKWKISELLVDCAGKTSCPASQRSKPFPVAISIGKTWSRHGQHWSTIFKHKNRHLLTVDQINSPACLDCGPCIDCSFVPLGWVLLDCLHMATFTNEDWGCGNGRHQFLQLSKCWSFSRVYRCFNWPHKFWLLLS